MDNNLSRLKGKFAIGVTDYAIYILLFAMFLVLTFLSKNFLTGRNLFAMILNGNYLLIISIGMAFVLLCGMIDLSVGSIAYVSMVVAGTLMRDMHAGVLLGLLVCLFVGGLIGIVNGLLIVKIGLNPMLVTLGMLIGLRGLGLEITQSFITEINERYKAMMISEIFGIPVVVILIVVIFVAAQLVLSTTRFGKYVIAIGCNEKAARNLGVNVDSVKMQVLCISGIFAAFAGFYCSLNLGTVLQTLGNGWEFLAIAICVLGGVSLFGGVGKIFPGVVVGFIIMITIEDGMNLLGVSIYLLPIVRGVVILLAMLSDSIRLRSSNRALYG
jgi:ribose/xylose/arabinose/galactoside ABC-type transport system permease subunit